MVVTLVAVHVAVIVASLIVLSKFHFVLFFKIVILMQYILIWTMD